MDVFFYEVRLRCWSTERQIKFYELTRQLLVQLPDADILDAITVVHDYEQLAIADPNELRSWKRLRDGILHLAEMLETKNKSLEADRLRSIAPTAQTY